MNQIAALLPPSNIVVDLDVATKPQFFTAIGRVFEQSSGLAQASVAASLAAREKLDELIAALDDRCVRVRNGLRRHARHLGTPAHPR